MRGVAPILIASAVLMFTAVTANAERLVFRAPTELTAVPVPSPDAERYAAQDVRVSRLETQSAQGLRRIIFADLPITGRLGTESVGSLARGTAANVGPATCVGHSVSEVREFVIDGKDAAEFTLICRGVVANGRIDAQTINVRRTVLIKGETRLYSFQADEYAPIATLDVTASAASWDESVASLRWCAGDAACEAR